MGLQTGSPDALTACHRLFVTEIARWQKTSSELTGAETGSVTFVQRFHSALGSFVHFHVVCPDGVFTRDASGVVSFHVGRAPSREEIASVAERVEKGMTRWLRKRKRHRRAPHRGAVGRGAGAHASRSLHAAVALRRDVPARRTQRRRGGWRRAPPGQAESVDRGGARLQHPRGCPHPQGRSRGARATVQVRRASAIQSRAPARSCPTAASPTA